jgi:hypothetical protein
MSAAAQCVTGGAGAWNTEAITRRAELAWWRQDGAEDFNHG